MARIDFGYILRRLRHDLGETLEQVSDATGLSVAMLSRIERGERLPSADSVEALAKHFGLSADYLMSETIAHRLVNRYGEEKSSRAAEHITREPADLELIAGPMDDEGDESHPGTTRASAPPAQGQPRRYGPFQEREILAALGAMAEPQDKTSSREGALRSAARLSPKRFGLMADERSRTGIDSATERILRAASETTEAAALLVRRQASALPLEARLELVDRISALAGHSIDLLQMLARDSDERVRYKAVRALRHLTRS